MSDGTTPVNFPLLYLQLQLLLIQCITWIVPIRVTVIAAMNINKYTVKKKVSLY